MAYFLKIEVTLKTTKGEFRRVSEASEFADSASSDLEIFGGILAYPDIRATRFRVLSSSDGVAYTECLDVDGGIAIYSATRPATGNFAYAIIPNLDLTSQGAAFTEAASTSDHDPNRVVYTEAAKPHDVVGSSIYVSGSDDNPVMRFEANTRPVSEGQYGYAPILCLSRRSVVALQVDDSGTIVSAAPIAGRGVVSRYGSCNAEGLIFMASDDGIWTLQPFMSRKPISHPVHAHEAADDLLDELSRDTALVHHDNGRGHSAVYVGGDTTHCYALDYNEWYTLPRSRTVLFSDGMRLLGVDASEGYVVEETKEVDTGLLTPAGVPFAMKSAAIKLGAPGFLKRLLRFGVRQRVGVDEVSYTVFDPLAPNEGPNENYTVSSDEDAFLAYTNTLTVNEELTAGGDVNVLSELEGALIAGGVLHPSVTDVRSGEGMVHDCYFVLAGRGKPGQGIESVDVEYEVRRQHGIRRRNVHSTLPRPSVSIALSSVPWVLYTEGHDSVVVMWGAVAGASGYRLWWGLASDAITNVIETGNTTATIETAGSGVDVFFYVEVY